jgi:hypothetical protein
VTHVPRMPPPSARMTITPTHSPGDEGRGAATIPGLASVKMGWSVAVGDGVLNGVMVARGVVVGGGGCVAPHLHQQNLPVIDLDRFPQVVPGADLVDGRVVGDGNAPQRLPVLHFVDHIPSGRAVLRLTGMMYCGTELSAPDERAAACAIAVSNRIRLPSAFHRWRSAGRFPARCKSGR